MIDCAFLSLFAAAVAFVIVLSLGAFARVELGARSFFASLAAGVTAIAVFPVLALAQIDGGTVVGILPLSDKAKATVAFAWLGLFYLAGLLKRFIPSHTIVGKGLDFITQDTRPPAPPVP